MIKSVKRIASVLVVTILLSLVGSGQPAHAGKLEKIFMYVNLIAWLSGKIACEVAVNEAQAKTLKANRRYDCDFPNIDFSNMNLSNVTIGYKNLSGSRFVGTNLSGAQLTGSIQGGNDFTGANLTGANMTYAKAVTSLASATLTGATLSNADLRTTDLMGVTSGGIVNVVDQYHAGLRLPTGWGLTNGFLVGPGANVTTTNFSGGNFTGIDLSTRSMPWNFTGANLGNANMTKTVLTGATVEGADFSKANLTGVITGKLVGTPKALPANWVKKGGFFIGPGANLLGADLTNVDLSTLVRANLINLTSGQIKAAPSALPAGYKLIDGHIVGPGVSLKNINVQGQDLRGMDLTGVSSSGVYGVPLGLPAGWKLTGGFLLGPGANLDGVTGANIDLSGLDLRGTSVKNVHASGLTGLPMLDAGVKIVNGYLIGPGADLTGFDLSGANLTGVDIADTILTNVKSGGITGTPLNSKNVRGTWGYQYNPVGFYNGYLVGNGANLAGANLNGMIIPCGLDFRNTNLTGASFENVYFENWRDADEPVGSRATYDEAKPFCIANFAGANLDNIKTANIVTHVNPGFYDPVPTCSSEFFYTQTRVPVCTVNHRGIYMATLATGLLNKSLKTLSSASPATGLSANLASFYPSTRPDMAWKFYNGFIVGPGVDLSGQNLSNLNTASYDLTGTNLTGANITGADFSSQSLKGVISGGLIGTPKALPVGWKFANGYFIGPGANLDGADLSGWDLSGMNLTGVNLSNTVLEGTNFQGATLKNVISSGITGTPLNLQGVTLLRGSLLGEGSQIGETDLSYTNVKGLNLDKVDLSKANLTGITSGVIGTPSALPAIWDFYNGYLIGPEARLENLGDKLDNADLMGDHLDGAQLSGTNLKGVRATLIEGIPASLPVGWRIMDGTLVGPGANLTEMSLVGQDFSGMNLTGVNFNGSNLNEVNLAGTNLTNVRSGGIFGEPLALPAKTRLIDGYLVGPGVNLSNAKFGNVSFARTTLEGVRSGGITGNISLPNPYRLFDGYIIGPGVNLDNAAFDKPIYSRLGPGSFTASVSLSYDSNGIHGGNITYSGEPLLGGGWFMLKTGTQGALNVGNLIGPGADLTGMSFRGVDFSALLPYQKTTLAGLDLSTADLYGAKSKGLITAFGKLPVGWKLFKGWLVGPGADLTGANLAKINLDGVDLTGANLSGATLTAATGRAISAQGLVNVPTGYKVINGHLVGPGLKLDYANLSGGDLSGMNLTGAKFTGANLTGANLTGANLSGVNLDTAILDGIKSGNNTQGPSRLPPGYWKKIKGYLVGPGANLAGANFSGLRFPDGTYWTSANLRGANFSGSSMLWAQFWKADLTSANFTGATTDNSSFYEANLTNANLTNANLNEPYLAETDLTGITMTGMKSRGIMGTPKVLPIGVKLINGVFIGRGARIGSVSMAGSNFSNADLTNLDFKGVNLTGANFAGSNITGVDFTNANLSLVRSGGLTGTPAFLPAGWRVISGYLVGPKADLAGANLHNVNLSTANLVGVKSGGITGIPAALPTGFKFLDGYLIGQGVDITGANLSAANLQGINLAGATLNGVNLSGTKLLGAVLTGVVSKDVMGIPGNASLGTKVVNGYILGPGVDLTGADLRNIDMTGVSLSGAKLTGVFSGSGTVTGVPIALPTDWKLIGGYLVGPGANLGKMDYNTDLYCNYYNSCDPEKIFVPNLSGYDLRGMNLTGTRFADAILTNVNFANATLSSATLTGADITGSNFDGVKLTKVTGTTGWGCVEDNYMCYPVRSAGVSFVGATITDVNFTMNNFSGVNFSGSVMTDVNFTGSTLSNANLSNVSLTRVKLNGANLSGANITGADLSKVVFTNSGVRTGGLIGSASLPVGYQLSNGYLVGSGVDLTGASLGTSNLSLANLSGIKSGSVTGTPTLPSGWALVNGYLVGPGANLTGADLTDVDLSNVQLDGVISGGVRGTPTLPSGWKLIAGYLIGRGVTVTASLSGDLSDVDLTGSKIGVYQYNDYPKVTGLPAGWKLVQGDSYNFFRLVGPGAVLTNINYLDGYQPNGHLVGDFSGVDLTGVDFSSTSIGNVNFTGANLTDAVLGTATFYDWAVVRSSGIIGTPKSLPPGWTLVDGELIRPDSVNVSQ